MITVAAVVFMFAMWADGDVVDPTKYYTVDTQEECQILVDYAHTAATAYANSVGVDVNLLAACVTEDSLVEDSI